MELLQLAVMCVGGYFLYKEFTKHKRKKRSYKDLRWSTKR